MTELPISVCLISGAEAPRIGRALESVREWTNEIIVVLNEDVRDGTEEIARSAGARVHREPWKGYVAQKNSSAAKATQPWILGLDADEVVSAELALEIGRLFERGGGPAASAYSFPRCTMFCGRWIRHGDWYPDRQTRLWRAGAARWAGEDLHEKLAVQGDTRRLKSDLLHYTALSIDSQIAKIAAYSNDFVRTTSSRPVWATWFDLGFRPNWRFFRAYWLRLGFLDGWQGYYIAWMTAFYSATRYAKRLEQQQTAARAHPAPGGKP